MMDIVSYVQGLAQPLVIIHCLFELGAGGLEGLIGLPA